MQNDAFERLAQVPCRENEYFSSNTQICEKWGVACHDNHDEYFVRKIVAKHSCSVYLHSVSVTSRYFEQLPSYSS